MLLTVIIIIEITASIRSILREEWEILSGNRREWAPNAGSESIPKWTPLDTTLPEWSTDRSAIDFYNKGIKNSDEDYFMKSLMRNPLLSQAWNNIGTLQLRKGKLSEALYCTANAFALDPTNDLFIINLANTRVRMGHYEDASILFSYYQKHHPHGDDIVTAVRLSLELNTHIGSDKALSRSVNVALSSHHENLFKTCDSCRQSVIHLIDAYLLPKCNEFVSLGKYSKAIVIAKQILSLSGEHKEAKAILQKVSRKSKKRSSSETDLDIAIKKYQVHDFIAAYEYSQKYYQTHPTDKTCVYLLSSCLSVLGRLDEAVGLYKQISSEIPSALVEMSNIEQRCCSWNYYETNFARLWKLNKNEIGGDFVTQNPFSLIGYQFSGSEIRTSAVTFHNGIRKRMIGDGFFKKKSDRQIIVPVRSRITVTILTSDLGNTNVGRLILSWMRLSSINNKDVDTYVVKLPGSSGLTENDEDVHWWKKTVQSVSKDRLIVFSERVSPQNIAKSIRDVGTDVLINLNGFSKYQIHEIFHIAPAPIAINYLGTALTYGLHDKVQFIIADRMTVPANSNDLYVEKIIVMPHSYFITSYNYLWSKEIDEGDEILTRSMVFCNFNHLNKVTPAVFAVWMNVLFSIPESRLWLLQLPAEAVSRLLLEASARGIDSERIVITPLFKLQSHIYIKKRCDLFLDTPLFNAHSTAADVLWSGIPLLTIQGGTYAARVASSHLHQMNQDYLISKSFREYERKAILLGRDRNLLVGIRKSIEMKSSPLFQPIKWVAAFHSASLLLVRMMRLTSGRPFHLVVSEMNLPRITPDDCYSGKCSFHMDDDNSDDFDKPF